MLACCVERDQPAALPLGGTNALRPFDAKHTLDIERRHARRHGLENRLHYIDGGDLDSLAKDARGLVCVNSTSATLALANGTPVCTIGEAIYDMPGLTHQRHLDQFWSDPTPPEPGVYEAFRRVLVDRCLVRGGLASESAVTELIGSILKRFEADLA